MDCVVGQQRVYSGELRFINGDYICDDCAHDVARLFERALEHEVEYPPRYGSNLIDVRPYLEYLPTTFLRDYTIRRRDYDTDAEQMVYCQARVPPNGEVCNNFLGVLSQTAGEQNLCSSYTSTSCACCKAVLTNPSAQHTCATEEDTPITDHLADNTSNTNSVPTPPAKPRHSWAKAATT